MAADLSAYPVSAELRRQVDARPLNFN